MEDAPNVVQERERPWHAGTIDKLYWAWRGWRAAHPVPACQDGQGTGAVLEAHHRSHAIAGGNDDVPFARVDGGQLEGVRLAEDSGACPDRRVCPVRPPRSGAPDPRQTSGESGKATRGDDKMASLLEVAIKEPLLGVAEEAVDDVAIRRRRDGTGLITLERGDLVSRVEHIQDAVQEVVRLLIRLPAASLEKRWIMR